VTDGERSCVLVRNKIRDSRESDVAHIPSIVERSSSLWKKRICASTLVLTQVKKRLIRRSTLSQITLYLDDETAARMKAAAGAEGLSQSKWVVKLIHQKTTGEWPSSVASLAGAWGDLPDPVSLRDDEGTSDVHRESL
jgi:hypothetical protein